MSQTTLPDGQTAYNNLYNGVHQRVFFQKCAAHGYAPRDDREAQWMLETAGKLRAIDQSAPVKRAADERNPYYAASRALDNVMARHGLAAPQYQEQATAVKQAAYAYADDPVLYNSILALKAAEAEQIRAHLEAQRS